MGILRIFLYVNYLNFKVSYSPVYANRKFYRPVKITVAIPIKKNHRATSLAKSTSYYLSDSVISVLDRVTSTVMIFEKNNAKKGMVQPFTIAASIPNIK